MNRALIIGAGCFSDRMLVEKLVSYDDWEVRGTRYRSSEDLRMKSFSELDITDSSPVERVMTEFQPEYAINFVGWTDGEDSHVFYMIHCQGALN